MPHISGSMQYSSFHDELISPTNPQICRPFINRADGLCHIFQQALNQSPRCSAELPISHYVCMFMGKLTSPIRDHYPETHCKILKCFLNPKGKVKFNHVYLCDFFYWKLMVTSVPVLAFEYSGYLHTNSTTKTAQHGQTWAQKLTQQVPSALSPIGHITLGWLLNIFEIHFSRF